MSFSCILADHFYRVYQTLALRFSCISLGDVVVPRARTRYGERRFNVSAATLRKCQIIQTAPSLNIFENLLKTHLFAQED
jgi:hypothetical protein